MSRRLPECEWPGRLRDLEEPPRELHLAGCLPGPPRVAVVGTRRPSGAGADFAAGLAADLSRAGVCVLSGGAEGIDAAAHRGALAAGGSTLVVAPAGWQRPFPPEHAELFRDIVVAGGGYLSLCNPCAPATRSRFFPRNACLVALADAVVVVEAGVRSGARNAAKHARVLGRQLFAVPSAPWIKTGRGCLLELRMGAALCESAKDVLAYLAASGAHAVGQEPQLSLALEPGRPSDPASPAEGTPGVLDAIRLGANTPDAVCERTGLEISEVQRTIFDLRISGQVTMDPTGLLFFVGG